MKGFLRQFIRSWFNLTFLLILFLGLPLLQAKNDRGEKPFNVTNDRKVKEFLEAVGNKNTVSSFRATTEGFDKRAVPKHTLQECEEFILILSHLVQSYFRMTRAAADNWINFAANVDNLEDHVTRMLTDSRLSSVINIRLAAMRMLTK